MRQWRHALLALVCCLLAAGTVAAEGQEPGRRVAITIDDLPLPGGSSPGELEEIRDHNARMLKALRSHRVPAIGFVNESRVHVAGERDERTAILQMWLDAGMELGNHTYSHPDLNTTPLRDFQDDVLHGEVITRALMEAAGKELRFFRFPYNHLGADAGTKEAFQAFLRERGYRVAPFTVEHADYAFDKVYSGAGAAGDRAMMDRVRSAYLEQLDVAFSYFEEASVDLLGREIPQVFLIHVNGINAECMEDMLRRLKARDYTFISLEEALEDPAYRMPDDYVGRFGISWMHRWTVSKGLPMRRDEPDPPPFLLEAYRAATGG
jgi:peptidoglycan/xylan/chitin deacetylase (PgdA/CDA1 family)